MARYPHVSRQKQILICCLMTAFALPGVSSAADWDGEPWADYTTFMSPVTLSMKQNLVAIKTTGELEGRVAGRMGQIGDSISYSYSFFRNAVVYPLLNNETGHDYDSIRSWLAYSGTQPADTNAFYFTHGKGADYGNNSGWRVSIALAAGHPQIGVEVGDGSTPGNYSWVTIMLGTNDIEFSNWDPLLWKELLKSFAQQFMDLGVIPVLSTVPPEVGHIADGKTLLVNDAIKGAAYDLNIPYVDYYAVILHHHPDDWFDTLIGPDGVHPVNTSWGRSYSQDALTNTDGQSIRSKLALDMAEKLRGVVFDGAAAEPDPDLVLELTTDSLSWNRLPFATFYDAVVGDLNELRDHAGDYSLATDSCVEEDQRELSSTDIADLDDPSPGNGTWVLIRATVSGSPGSYGAGAAAAARDVGILASGSDCQP